MPLADIDHVFVLMLENRSFDHMLAAVPLPGADVAGPGSFTNLDGTGASYRNAVGAPIVMPTDPPHEYDDVVLQLLGGNTDPPFNYNTPAIPIAMSGFVRSYAQKAAGGLDAILSSFDPAVLPFLSYLAQEYCVCDRWFSSLPGPTLPNRFFLCAASSDGDPKSPSALSVADGAFIDPYRFANGDIFQRIKQTGSLGFRIYRGDTLPFSSLLAGVDYLNDTVAYDPAGFAADCSDPNLPAFVFIEPSYGIFNDFQDGTSQHPRADVTRGDRLVGEVYTAILGSTAWAHSVLILTYDEHGGFFDHVVPPAATPPSDAPNTYDFLFDRLGVRVPAIIVSPLLAQRRRVDHTPYDHTSVLATLNQRFPQIGTFTQRDAHAAGLGGLFAGPADASPLPPPPPLAPTAPVDLAQARVLPDDGERMESPEVIGLKIAGKLRHEVRGVPKETVLAELAQVRTKGGARSYMREVHAALSAAPGRR
jgi:phospholipase C